MTEKRLMPFGGRATVMPSPVDEDQHASGLIVPTNYAGVRRGVVLDIDDDGRLLPIESGAVVYYREGCEVKVGDVAVVELRDIVAYEGTPRPW